VVHPLNSIIMYCMYWACWVCVCGVTVRTPNRYVLHIRLIYSLSALCLDISGCQQAVRMLVIGAVSLLGVSQSQGCLLIYDYHIFTQQWTFQMDLRSKEHGCAKPTLTHEMPRRTLSYALQTWVKSKYGISGMLLFTHFLTSSRYLIILLSNF
jgi:hypothetical protein